MGIHPAIGLMYAGSHVQVRLASGLGALGAAGFVSGSVARLGCAMYGECP